MPSQIRCTGCNNQLLQGQCNYYPYRAFCFCSNCFSRPDYFKNKFKLIQVSKYQQLQKKQAQLQKKIIGTIALSIIQFTIKISFQRSKNQHAAILRLNSQSQQLTQLGSYFMTKLNNIIEASIKTISAKLQKCILESSIHESNMLIQLVRAYVEKSQVSISKTEQYYKSNQQHLGLLSVQLEIKIPSSLEKHQFKKYAIFEESESTQLLAIINKKIEQLKSRHQRLSTLLRTVQDNKLQILKLFKFEEPKEFEQKVIESIDNDKSQQKMTMLKSQGSELVLQILSQKNEGYEGQSK